MNMTTKTNLHPTHKHQFAIQPPKRMADVFVRELRHSARKGVFGVLSPVKSIYGGPTAVIDFIYWPKRATRKQAQLAAERYAAACK